MAALKEQKGTQAEPIIIAEILMAKANPMPLFTEIQSVRLRAATWERLGSSSAVVAEIDKAIAAATNDLPKDTSAPLCKAVEENRTGAIKDLLEAKANPTTLLTGLQSVRSLVVSQKDSFMIEVIDNAIARAANAPDERGHSPLCNAIYDNDSKKIHTLLAAKADPNLKDNHNIPFFLAIVLSHDNPEMTEILLAAKANPKATTTEGQRVCDFARALLGFKKISASIDKAIETAANELDEQGHSPLCTAIALGNDNIESLLADKANPNKKDNRNIPLYFAITQGDYPEVAKKLLQAKADPRAKIAPDYDPPPLEAAALLRARAKAELKAAKSPEGQTILQLAESLNVPKIVAVLREAIHRSEAIASLGGLHSRAGATSAFSIAASRSSIFDRQVMRLPLRAAGCILPPAMQETSTSDAGVGDAHEKATPSGQK